MRFTTGLLSAVLLWALSVVTVHAQKRVALVVGIDRYVNLSAGHQLTTAGYDARLIGDALSRVGFDVIRAQDVGRAAFVAKLRELQRKLTPGDFVFFYFAGHGVSFGGANYILPSDVPDVRAGQEARLASAALGEDDIVADLKRRRIKAAIMILDASRPVPFSQANALRAGWRSRLPGTAGFAVCHSAGIQPCDSPRLLDRCRVCHRRSCEARQISRVRSKTRLLRRQPGSRTVAYSGCGESIACTKGVDPTRFRSITNARLSMAATRTVGSLRDAS
jgi:Caspase domain